MEEKKKQSEYSTKIDVDQIGTAIIVVNSDHTVLDMNRAAQRLFGVGDSRRRKSMLSDILVDPVGLQNIINKSIRYSSTIVEREMEIQIDPNYSKVIDCVVSPTNNLESNDLGCFVEISDKELSQQIKDTSDLYHQSDIWETIARELGHEIRNPLTGIKGTVQLLRGELKTDRYDEFINTIVEEVERLSVLSNRMLGADVSSLDVQRVNVHEILDRVHALVIAEKSLSNTNERRSPISNPKEISISKLYQPPIFVDGDRDQLTQIFLNLLRNAVQAISHKGEVTISTRIGLKTTIGNKIYGKVVEVRFIDDGEGVDPKSRNSIFLPLVSYKKGGSGLGLPIAQKLARANRGIITLERNIKRTEFLVRIPIGEEFGSS